MHIKEIHIDGFGLYNDFRLNGLKRGVNVIIGKNEAGKSTLHRFIRYTLFGYPRLRDRRMPPVRGDVHGGRIIAEMAAGEELVIDRSGSGRLSVIAGRKEFESDKELVRLLGNTNEAIYNKVYAFTLDELVNLDSLAESGVEDKIFSVGMGLGNISLAGIEEGVKKDIDTFHKPGGRGRLIGDYLKRAGEIKELIAAKQTLMPKRRELKGFLEKLDEESRWLQAELQEKTALAARLENLLKCHNSCIKYLRVVRELEDLTVPAGYPEKGIDRLEKLEEKREELTDRLRIIEDGGAGDKGVAELKELAKDEGYNRKLAGEAGRVEYVKENLSMYSAMLKDYREDAAAAEKYRKEMNELVEGIDRSWTPDTVEGLKSGEIHRSAIQSFISRLDEIKKKRLQAEAYAQTMRQATGPAFVRRIAALASVLLLIASIPAFYYSLHVAGGALVLAAFAVFAGSRITGAEKPARQADDEIDNLKEQEEKILSSYNSYMSERIGVRGPVPPESSLQLLAGIDKCADLIDRIRELETRQEERKSFFDQYEPVVLSLAPVAGFSEDAGNANIESLAHIIAVEFAKADEKRKQTEKYRDELKARQREADNLGKRLEELDNETGNLLRTADASTPDEFRKKGMIYRRFKELMSEKVTVSTNIEAIMGAGRLDEVVEWFGNTGVEQTEAELTGVKHLCADLDIKIKDINVKTGEIKGEIARIEAESDMAESLTEFETVKTRLGQAVEEWLAGRMAIELLSEVRARYEEEKQPAVISNAAGYFKSVTAGAYSRLHVSTGSKEVLVYNNEGKSKTTGQLSRGTREQLLICLRLGFIEEYERQSEPLPLVTDEVLVNFDPERAESMAGLFLDFCKDRQMLLFSCHPATAELFKGHNINVINIQAG